MANNIFGGMTSSYNTGASCYTNTSTTTGFSWYAPKTTYHVLGEDIKIDGEPNISIAMTIAAINILGKPYYIELLKQGIQFDKKLTNFIDQRLKITERDKKINDIINK